MVSFDGPWFEKQEVAMTHDRYLIYSLKGKWIEAQVPFNLGGNKIKGVVTDVFRDIFDDTIKLIIKNRTYVFSEPDRIFEIEGGIAFIYGDETSDDLKDEDLFVELRKIASKGGNVDDAISNLESTGKNGTIEFTVKGMADEKSDIQCCKKRPIETSERGNSSKKRSNSSPTSPKCKKSGTAESTDKGNGKASKKKRDGKRGKK